MSFDYTDPKTGKFKAGNAGRPKGSKNKPSLVIKRFEAVFSDYLEGEEFAKDFKELPAIQKFEVLAKLIAYIIPKKREQLNTFEIDPQTAEKVVEDLLIQARAEKLLQ